MAQATLQQIKEWFRRHKFPTQQQFWDTWDSFWHKDEKIPASQIEGLQEIFDGVTEGFGDALDSKIPKIEFTEQAAGSNVYSGVLTSFSGVAQSPGGGLGLIANKKRYLSPDAERMTAGIDEITFPLADENNDGIYPKEHFAKVEGIEPGGFISKYDFFGQINHSAGAAQKITTAVTATIQQNGDVTIGAKHTHYTATGQAFTGSTAGVIPLSGKQSIEDETLQTEDKTIVGAINEVKQAVDKTPEIIIDSENEQKFEAQTFPIVFWTDDDKIFAKEFFVREGTLEESTGNNL